MSGNKFTIFITGALVFIVFGALIVGGDRFNLPFAGKIVHWAIYAFYPARLTLVNPARIQLADDDSFIIIDKSKRRIIRAFEDGTYDLMLNSSSGAFIEACDAMIRDNDLLINSIDFGPSKMEVFSEKIISHNPETFIDNTVFTRSYDTTGERPALQTLFGPYLIGNARYLIATSSEGFTLINAITKQLVMLVPFPEANTVISSFTTDGTRIWFIHKKGIIYETVGTSTRIIYDGSKDSIETSLPWEITVHNGNLYWTDLARRAVVMLESSGKRQLVFTVFDNGAGGRTLPPNTVFYTLSVDSQGNVATIAGNTIVIKDQSGNTRIAATSFNLAPQKMPYKLGATAVLIIVAVWVTLAVLWFILKFFSIMMRTFFGKLGVSILIMIVISLAIVLNITKKSALDINEERIYALLATLTYSGGRMIDSEAFKKITKPSDYMNEDYMRLWDSLRRLIDHKSDWASGIYAVLYRYENSQLDAVLFLDGTSGAYYPFESTEGIDIEAVYRGEMGRGIVDDKAGTWLHVFGPLYDDQNTVVGIIEVGVETTLSTNPYKNINNYIFSGVAITGIIVQMLVMILIKVVSRIKAKQHPVLRNKS
jgi:hypothetical protein